MKARIAFHLASHTRIAVSSTLKDLVGSLLAAVFPTTCLLCRKELTQPGGASVCDACWEDLLPWTGTACACCGLPLASPQAVSGDDARCGRCRQEKYAFDLARSYGVYKGSLRQAILEFKFHGRAHMGERLGGLLAQPWDSLPDISSALVMPVPLHFRRRRERGYNQAEALAKGLLRKLRKEGKFQGVRYLADSLRRTRATLPQVGLNEAARRENVRGVFSVERPEDVRGHTVVIVDDVMTTGATLSACAAALKHAGAERVFALMLARATPQFPAATTAGASSGADGAGYE